MSIEMSAPAPDSLEGKVLAELEKEGHTIKTEQPQSGDGVIKDTIVPKEQPKEDPKPKEEAPKDEPKKDDIKTSRTPTMVEAYKLKIAEDQKEKLAQQVSELSSKIEELSKQKAPVTQAQEKDIADEIKALAQDNPNLDVDSLTKLADILSKRLESKVKPSTDLENTVKKLQEEKEIQAELAAYSNEFEKDVMPLLADYQLSGEALSQIKETLKGYAFSETYARVPLKEIFAIKNSELNLSVPKKSSEGKGIKSRATDTVVDIDNLSEEDFAKLPAEKVEEFIQKKSSGSWQRR
jgi:hypothetical protein